LVLYPVPFRRVTMDTPTITIRRFIAHELERRGCPIDADAAEYLAHVWQKLHGPDSLDTLAGYLEILADYDYGDTESGQMDCKTVECFLDEELGYDRYE